MSELPLYLDELSPSYFSNSGRLARYRLLYKMWRNDAYSGTGVSDLVDNLGLYKFIRGLYNPTYRLAAFYGEYVYSGNISNGIGVSVVDDDDNSDGYGSGVLPIVTSDDSIRKYISNLLRNTNLLRMLNVIAEWGCRDGDVFIAINMDDDNSVQFEVLRPTDIKELELDGRGDITHYLLERPHTNSVGFVDKYSEDVTLLEDGSVVYKVRNGISGTQEVYTRDYGFIPVVHIAHNYTGLILGSPAIRPSIVAAIELDDSSSKLFDQVRKMVDPAWLMSGVRQPTRRTDSRSIVPSEQDSVGKQYVKMFYSNDSSARAWPLVADLQISSALENILRLLDAISLNHPELKVAAGLDNSSGDISGRAYITSRASASQRIATARLQYDAGVRDLISRAYYLQSGIKTLPPVQLSFNIGDRPVFPSTEAELLDLEKAWWINAGLAERVHIPVSDYMKMTGKPAKLLSIVEDSKVYQAYLEQVTNVYGEGFGALRNRAGEEVLTLQKQNGNTDVAEPNLPFGDFDANS